MSDVILFRIHLAVRAEFHGPENDAPEWRMVADAAAAELAGTTLDVNGWPVLVDAVEVDTAEP